MRNLCLKGSSQSILTFWTKYSLRLLLKTTKNDTLFRNNQMIPSLNYYKLSILIYVDILSLKTSKKRA